MTLLELASQGSVTQRMTAAAALENIPVDQLAEGITQGRIVLPANINRPNTRPAAIGTGLSVKVNANIGTSEAFPDVQAELTKLDAVVSAGADAVMDLSTGGAIDLARQAIIKNSPVIVGTVPVYQVMVETVQNGLTLAEVDAGHIFDAIEKHCRDGADFLTVHCGVNLEVIEKLQKNARIMDIVSRGGAFMTAWMLHNQQENPLYADFGRLLDIARRYDVTLSLGDGLRPGCVSDASDAAQIQELITLGMLVKEARSRGVQVMVEGPGHMTIDQIQANMVLAKSLCHGAPLYVLGPLVTDIAPGYDHITAAIGGAIAAMSGADFLCYVTPAEHLGLPTAADAVEGVVAARIAAHAADLGRGLPGSRRRDEEMARARKALDWNRQIELAIYPDKALQVRRDRNEESQPCCTMCGQFCAYKLISQYLGEPVGGGCHA